MLHPLPIADCKVADVSRTIPTFTSPRFTVMRGLRHDRVTQRIALRLTSVRTCSHLILLTGHWRSVRDFGAIFGGCLCEFVVVCTKNQLHTTWRISAWGTRVDGP